MRKAIAILSILLFVLALHATSYALSGNIVVDGKVVNYNVPDVSITVDGNPFNTYGNPPLILDGNTIVPLRSIAQGLGASVNWDGTTQTITITKEKVFKFFIGKNYATVDGNQVQLPAPARLINYDTSYVPMRFLFESLGYDVKWIGDKYLIQVTSKTPDPQTSNNVNITSFSSTYANGVYTVTLKADGPLVYQKGILTDSSGVRVYFDFDNAINAVTNKQISINQGGLNMAYIGQNQLQPAITRFVVSMSSSLLYTITQSQDKKEFDISFNIGSPSQASNNGPLIYIDPGHGGSDPGAIGIGGIHEADIALAIGLKLKTLLDNGGFRTMMSRTTDTYVGLYDRPDQANSAGADAFVSIHCDAFDSPSANGTTVLYYPNGYNGDTRDDKTFAQIIHDNLMQEINTTDRGLSERPNLVVLNQTKMVAVLVETGFVTSPTDAQLLTDDNFQWKVAQGIYNGIVQYFNELKSGAIKSTIS
ncbi:N-acetylmuramoyl-L-alanine amidase [Thermoanaerobacterium xylanolyticum LX-11]|uniref:N-acetylmuramoyl-L-alanine amidase n=1 Tax=Thermoanaerobacterium xylanolyticum (strain ATCC 49914 / DSM 7097 / LX-11) TaxID=858215 RepID=F6BL80_THEXL|nr:N-acetylmuramoyl-L-alanine amidase [Thermoanaerobacterium xylanolyticum]AEF18213.1 N-acetylmuramoyl-L-alanine amidase [Thermoanaerobacterium xylanolyticum LX-11]